MLRKGMRLVGQGAEALAAIKCPNLVDDENLPSKREEVIKRKMRELRMKKKNQFESIICQVDRTTGEISIPKADRGMIRALRRGTEHRTIGWIIAAVLTVCMIAGWRHGDRDMRPKLETYPLHVESQDSTGQDEHRARGGRTRGSSLAVAAETKAITVTAPVSASLESVKVGQVIRHRIESNGTLVMYSEDLFETRPVSAGSSTRQSSTARTSSDTRVNINTASVEELDAKLSGVGPVMARMIVAARPFRVVEDLDNVSGIGPRRLAVLKPFVTVN